MTLVEYKIVATTVFGTDRPLYPPETFGGFAAVDVSLGVIEEFNARISNVSVMLDPKSGRPQQERDILSVVIPILKRSNCVIQSAVVNDSRPTADPKVWLPGSGRLYVHPVIKVEPRQQTLVHSETPAGLWHYACVIVHPA